MVGIGYVFSCPGIEKTTYLKNTPKDRLIRLTFKRLSEKPGNEV